MSNVIELKAKEAKEDIKNFLIEIDDILKELKAKKREHLKVVK
jgi:hypothetical protein